MPSIDVRREPLRDPFIFLTSYLNEGEDLSFTGRDYLEIIERLWSYQQQYVQHERTLLVQMRKFIVWMSAGFPGASKFRGELFKNIDETQIREATEEFYTQPNLAEKSIDLTSPFMPEVMDKIYLYSYLQTLVFEQSSK